MGPNTPLTGSNEWKTVQKEVEAAITSIVWPPNTLNFTIFGVKGKNSKGDDENGVEPIKNACMQVLEKFGWGVCGQRNPCQFDAIRQIPEKPVIGLEWETGNISSSHRSVNRILLGHYRKEIVGGILIVPSSELYLYLTDRIGNIGELNPYLPIWKKYLEKFWDDGAFRIYVVEEDEVSSSVPKIKKRTDGMANFRKVKI
jgi:hypothetical protein